MKNMTRILGLGLGTLALGAGDFFAQRAIRRRRTLRAIDKELEDLDEPVVVVEEVVVVTEPDPYYDIEMLR